MKKKITVLLLAALQLFSLAACGSAPAEPAPADTSEVQEAQAPEYPIESITIGTTAAIESALREEYNYDMLASAVNEPPLVCQDTEGSYHPLIADYSTEDAVTWTYTIKDGICWDDGEPVTAEDILFTLQYDDEHGSAYFVEQVNDKGRTVDARYTDFSLSEDKMSISLTLASPNVRELSNMTSFRIMPRHIYEGKDSVSEEEARIGCGPYSFESFNKEAGTISFAANPNFPQKPKAGKIIYRLFSNDDTMYLALQSGDIDMVWNYSGAVPAAYQDMLAEDENIQLLSVPAANVPAVLAFNNAKGFFTDENLRMAVSCALDYDVFKEYFGSQYAAVPNRGFAPATTVGFAETEKLSHDSAAAEDFMKAAGYESKNDDGFYVNADGVPAAFTLTVNAGKDAHMGYAELVKTQLEDFGIQVTLDAIDSDSYNAKTSNKFSENNITMEAAIYAYTAAGMGMMNGFGSIYVDGNHPVQGGCQVFDEDFSGILSEMKAATSLEEYYAGAEKLQNFYAEHCPLVALYWDSMMYAASAKYENMSIDAVFGLNNVNNWLTISAK